MWMKVKTISVFSAFKTGCLMGAVPLILGITALACWLSSLIPSFSYRSANTQLTASYGPMNVITLLPVIILYGLCSAIGPAIGLALWAMLYNIVARIGGGFHVQLRGGVNDDNPASTPTRTPPNPKTMSEDEYIRSVLAQRRSGLEKRKN